MMINFGYRIKLLRNRNELTQTQLAERIGVTKSMVSAYETSMRLPSFDTLIKIAFLFNVTTDYLLGMDDRDTMKLPTITEKQKQAIYNMIEAFKE